MYSQANNTRGGEVSEDASVSRAAPSLTSPDSTEHFIRLAASISRAALLGRRATSVPAMLEGRFLSGFNT